MKKYIKILMASLLVFTMIFSLAGCGQNKEASKEVSKVDLIKEKGKIVLGTSADYPPYEFHKEINGEDTIVGFDIEIAKAMAEELGVELEIKDMKFDGLLAGLKAGKIDFIVAGMSPTEERKKSVDFTQIYYKGVNKVLVRVEDKDKYNTVDDFKGTKVGAQKSSIQEDLAKNELKDIELKSLGKLTNLVLELENKKIDSIVVSEFVAEAYAKQNPKLALAGMEFGNGEDGSAIAIDKGNEELVKIMDKAIDKLKESGKLKEFIIEAIELSGE
ncbi:transporter substrate-binding domain-containing protein [Anaeromicrobium sediminis]|uniref:Amino acid ABC transporter n=1 Tax=Anaeromicrobium sediminis TaxID=1478221 RepID=A0A267MIY8_9FIRM|nr:transporter substrate-binding domain-containing protein [Anaeromicrobium sediminis]PAB59551.1 amino acid ABC transporter [Anaeromicrobium sediminis]